MDYVHVIWDLDEDPDGNVQRVREHGLDPHEVDEVLLDPDSLTTTSRSSGRPITSGYTSDGRHVAVVWERIMDDPLTVRPITA